jgi:hypothetical protein
MEVKLLCLYDKGSLHIAREDVKYPFQSLLSCPINALVTAPRPNRAPRDGTGDGYAWDGAGLLRFVPEARLVPGKRMVSAKPMSDPSSYNCRGEYC